MDTKELDQLNARVAEASKWVPQVIAEMRKAVVGQQYLVERLLIGLLSNGHVLLEGVPGLVGSSRVDLQACKLEYSIVSPK